MASVRALELTASWPVPTVAAAVVARTGPQDAIGDLDHEFRLASISKPIVAWAALIAVEEGLLSLETPIGQPGCTLRHLLSHAGGYPTEGTDPIAAPERKRIYSNSGIELAADAIAAVSEMPFEEYLRLGVFEPLGMSATALNGSPAHAIRSTTNDIIRFMLEVRTPTLISRAAADDAVRSQYPTLGGIVPGVGRFDVSPWGLGFEVRGDKRPHWTGSGNSAASFGHFGGSGTMMWLDPDAGIGLVALTDRMFDEWGATALRRWPELSDAVLEEFAGAGSR
jgi:CubicO group peptidase (beta-lactamase class C family)